MYVVASDACNIQSGLTPLSPAAIARSEALEAAADASVIAANNNWNGLIARDWRSFAALGPNVAYQLRDASAGIGTGVLAANPDNSGSGTASVPAAAAPVGIEIVGNSDGSNLIAGGGGSAAGMSGNWHTPGWLPRGGGLGPAHPIRPHVGRRGLTNTTPVLGPDDAAFLAQFGRPPFATYTGPRPDAGSVGSLIYGGQQVAIPVGAGVYPAPTPDPRLGYCGGPGVAVDSSGNPIAAAGGSSGPGVWLALAALLGVAYFADRSDKRHGRTRA